MINFSFKDDIAVIEIDDGKANVMNYETSQGIREGLKRAETEAQAVIIQATGNKFSAGFDLKTVHGPSDARDKMVNNGFELLYDIYNHPLPVVAACNGHALGLGAFILLVADTRIGAQGEYKIGLPETLAGMPFTPLLVSILQAELAKPYLKKAALQSQNCNPKTAIGAGFLDRVVAPEALNESAVNVAQQLMKLSAEYYTINKRLIRENTLRFIRKELDATK